MAQNGGYLNITTDVPNRPEPRGPNLCRETQCNRELFIRHEAGEAWQPTDSVQKEGKVGGDLVRQLSKHINRHGETCQP